MGNKGSSVKNPSIGSMLFNALLGIQKQFGLDCVRSCVAQEENHSFEIKFVVGGNTKTIEYRDADAYAEWVKTICKKNLEDHGNGTDF